MNSRELFHAAIEGNSPPRPPVWFMRQAGRLFSRYRELRNEYDFKELCQSSKRNAEVTCMPVEELNVDAAIIFSDILLPLESIGAGFELVPGEGPKLDHRIDEPDDVAVLSLESPREDLSYVYEAIERSLERLPAGVPLIGFAGAPFTLASYLIEGGRSRSLLKTRKFMLNYPEAWDRLMNLLVKLTVPYLEGQIDAGAEFLQLFDSWVGQLSPGLYQKRVLPFSRDIIGHFNEVPVIHFGTKTAGLLNLVKETGADVVSLDWRINIKEARRYLDDQVCLQGNLDPAALLGSFETITPQVDRILSEASSEGHIFNLGHGILPETEPETVKKLVNHVREWNG